MAFGLGGAPTLAPGTLPGRAPGMQNGLLALITALGQLPAIRQQQQMGQEELKRAQMQNKYGEQQQQLDMQTRQAQLQQQQRTNAQQTLDMMRPALIRNPHYASDPSVKARLQQAYSDLGVPMPTDAQGDIDVNALKIQPGDPRYAQVIDYGMALPAGLTRKAYFDAQQVFYTPEMISATAALSPRDQAALMRAKSLGLHEQNMDAAAQSRINISQELADSRMKTDDVRRKQILNQIQTSTMRAQAALTSANAAAMRAKTAQGVLDLRIKMFNQTPNIKGQQLVVQQARALQTEARSLDQQINTVQAQIEKAMNDGVGLDPSDPNKNNTALIDNLNNRLAELQQQRKDIESALAQANTIEASNLGAAGEVRSSTNAKSVTVTDPKGTPTVTRTGTAPDGSRIYLLSDGSMHVGSANGPIYNP